MFISGGLTTLGSCANSTITAVTRGLNDTGRQLALAQEGVTEFWANYNRLLSEKCD